jgi:UDP-N-acetylmuramyl pentapeptide phosphotransferase/UDP-N-acetylglucosamine-1-phosphate transferase
MSSTGIPPPIYFREEATMFVSFLALNLSMSLSTPIARQRWRRHEAPPTSLLGGLTILLQLSTTASIWLYWRVVNPDPARYISTLVLYMLNVLVARLLEQVLPDRQRVPLAWHLGIDIVRLASSVSVMALMIFEAVDRQSSVPLWLAPIFWLPNLILCVFYMAQSTQQTCVQEYNQ